MLKIILWYNTDIDYPEFS